MDCSMPGFPVLHYLPECPEWTWVHVHWVSDAIKPSHPLSSPFPALNLSQHQGFFPMSQLFALGGQCIEASASVLPINLPLGMTSLISLLSQGLPRVFLQYHSLKASILPHSAFSMIPLSHSYITIGKTIPLTLQTFVGKVMSLLFNTLSKFVTTFLSRTKHLLILWLESLYTVILEPKKIKSVTISIFYPIYLSWSDGTKCHDLSFLNVEF